MALYDVLSERTIFSVGEWNEPFSLNFRTGQNFNEIYFTAVTRIVEQARDKRLFAHRALDLGKSLDRNRWDRSSKIVNENRRGRTNTEAQQQSLDIDTYFECKQQVKQNQL